MGHKGITPIIAIIILLLIAIALAGAGWSYISMMYSGYVGKSVQISGSYATQNSADIILKNTGTDALDTSGCTTGSTGDVVTCGDITIRKIQGEGEMNITIAEESLDAGKALIIHDNACTQGTATYQISSGGLSQEAYITAGQDCTGVPVGQQCSDGTAYSDCSTTKPKYCDQGSLVDNCSECGCNPGDTCQPDESCVTVSCPDGTCSSSEECAADCSEETWCTDSADNDEDTNTDCADTADCDGELCQGTCLKCSGGACSLEDDSLCSDPGVCLAPDCQPDGSCGQSFVPSGQTDPGQCEGSTGCAGTSCRCDGAGGCEEQSVIYLGDGGNGSLIWSGGVLPDIAQTGVTDAGLFPGATSINVEDASGFFDGDEIMIIQSRSGISTGTYEFKTGITVSGSTISFSQGLSNTYMDSGDSEAQVVRVPNYQSVIVAAGNLNPPSWDGNTGGIVVFRATGTVSISSGASISSSGRGFLGASKRGCQGCVGYRGESELYPRDNSATTSRNTNTGGGGGHRNKYSGCGGGGGSHNESGANGGHPYYTGTNYDCTVGTGGAVLPSQKPLTEQLVFGGAGGGGGCCSGYSNCNKDGAGGAGGGAVLIFANEITVAGAGGIYASANSGSAATDSYCGSGGGGAGGSILLVANTMTLSSDRVKATGGSGGDIGGSQYSGDGGAGSQGRIEVNYATSFSGTTSPEAVVKQL